MLARGAVRALELEKRGENACQGSSESFRAREERRVVYTSLQVSVRIWSASVRKGLSSSSPDRRPSNFPAGSLVSGRLERVNPCSLACVCVCDQSRLILMLV